MRVSVALARKILLAACAIVALAAIPPILRADTSSATLTVTVTDSSGAVIPSAVVILRNAATDQRESVNTDGRGSITFPFLKPAQYAVLVQKRGFAEVSISDVVLNVGDNRDLQVVMKIGAESQTVKVDGSGPTINTTDGSVGTVVNRQFVQSIPLNGRSFQDLILLTPGVVTQSPQSNPPASLGNNGDFSVNGQRAESNSYEIDGISANTSAGGGGSARSGNVQSSTALGTTQSLLSVDALQEFRVNSSSYSAEYGRTPGGQFSFVTRSGTDDFHGTAFDYLRNNYFDANNWFNDYYRTAEPALRQNDFGGTLGGPIRIPRLYNGRGKSFFFASYEGLRLTQPQPAELEYVPSIALRQNPMLPAVMKQILDAFPLPTAGGIDLGTGLAQFIQSDSLPSQIDSTSVRLDQVLSSKVHLFFRFSDTPSSSAARTLSVMEHTLYGTQTYTLGATVQASPNVSDEFRLGYTKSNYHDEYLLDNFEGAQPIDLAAALGLNASGNTVAGTGPEVALFFGGNFSFLSLSPSISKVHQWNLTDTLSLLYGKHAMKFGVDYRYIESPAFPETPSADYIYTNQSQVLANSAALGIGAISSRESDPIFHQFSAFAQDEWRPISRLGVSLGLRWDVNPPPGSGYGPLPYTLLGNLDNPADLSLAPRNTPLWKTAWYNFAPRLGVAWTLNNTPGHQTVLRAGGGVFFDTGNQAAALGFGGSPGNYAYEDLSGVPVPFPNLGALTLSTAPPYTNTAVYSMYPHLQLPYTLEWSSAIEQAFGQSQTLTISYVAANGRRLLQENELSLTALNPDFGSILRYTNGPTSNYQSLQAKFQRSVTHGLQALVAYTWSHSLDYGSNFLTIPLQRGNSDFDVRNNFTAGATWQSPIFNGAHILKAILNTWSVDGHVIARSGFPVNIVGNEAIDAATGALYFGGVDLVANQPLYLHSEGLPGGREINRAAFSLPPAGAIGNAPRNFVRGFGATQVNLAVRRQFHLKESLNLQISAESFNLLNHPIFGTIESDLTESTFGQATATLNQSLATTSSLYQMGGPRSMQFAMKLQF